MFLQKTSCFRLEFLNIFFLIFFSFYKGKVCPICNPIIQHMYDFCGFCCIQLLYFYFVTDSLKICFQLPDSNCEIVPVK